MIVISQVPRFLAPPSWKLTTVECISLGVCGLHHLHLHHLHLFHWEESLAMNHQNYRQFPNQLFPEMCVCGVHIKVLASIHEHTYIYYIYLNLLDLGI